MPSPIAAKLIRWYGREARDLPWRRTRDPWRILVSEVMLQQTRVETVLPYYHRFLDRYPDAAAFAAAPEPDILALWAGLGYYTRVRNLQAAARRIVELGAFPDTYDGIRALPGVGDYTAAAVSSICFGLPHAVVDGNVLRVVARLTNDPADIAAPATRKRFAAVAQSWIDARRPAAFNQALMELGATVCAPRTPRCLLCPVARECAGLAAGRERELPIKLKKGPQIQQDVTLYLIERRGAILLWRRGDESKRMRGFWELPGPDDLPGAEPGGVIGTFSHTITVHHYRVTVRSARVSRVPARFAWVNVNRLAEFPVSTMTKKSLGFHL